MPSERYELVKVKASNPEQFVMVWFALDQIPMRTDEPKPEATWRAEFKKAGRAEVEINYLLECARKLEAYPPAHVFSTALGSSSEPFGSAECSNEKSDGQGKKVPLGLPLLD